MENPNIQTQQEVVSQNNIENINLVPIKVNDLRNSQYMGFDLNKFLNVISRLRSEGLYKLSREFKDSDYGKYMSTFASNESDNWNEAIRDAKAIEIILTTAEKNYGRDFFIGRTKVDVKILMSEKEGREFNFFFDKDGKYSKCDWSNVHLQKRLSDVNKPDDFTLEVENNTPKELE